MPMGDDLPKLRRNYKWHFNRAKYQWEIWHHILSIDDEVVTEQAADIQYQLDDLGLTE